MSTRCPSSGAVPVGQRSQDAAQRVQPGEHIDNRHTGFGGITRFGSGDAHQAADRLHQQVVAGQRRAAAAAESRDGAVDHVGADRAKVVIAQTEPAPWSPAGSSPRRYRLRPPDRGPAARRRGRSDPGPPTACCG